MCFTGKFYQCVCLATLSGTPQLSQSPILVWREPTDSSCGHALFFLKNANYGLLLNLLRDKRLFCLVIHHIFFLLSSNLCYGWPHILGLEARFSETS